MSDDGIRWRKPTLDVEPGTNIVLRQYHDGGTVWLDGRATDPSRRYKLLGVDVSDGYVAAGGPGFVGPTDTKGVEAYP